MTPTNRFKTAILEGRRQIGFWLATGDPIVAEICAGAGFDWLVIDAEHTPQHLPGILAQLQAIGCHPDCHAVVRVPSPDPATLKHYLDAGAQTLLVPMVNTAEQAAAIVRACRYPPEGERGIGGARASGWGRHTDYLTEANRQVCVMAQIETAEAVANLDGILAVPGLDALFVGPADLSASLGHPGKPSHPDVERVIVDTMNRIRKGGKPAGILTRDEALAKRLLDEGASFVNVGIDTLLLAQQTSAVVKRFSA